MKKTILILSATIILSACGAPSVEDLIEDPAKLGEINAECQMMMAQGKDTNTEECINARKAISQMTNNMLKGSGFK